MYLFFLNACDFSVLLTVSILLIAMREVMAFLTTLGFVTMSLIPSLTVLLLVVTNDFLEDMILVLDLL